MIPQVQQMHAGALITLYEIDWGSAPGTVTGVTGITRISPKCEEDGSAFVWQGNTYEKMNVEMTNVSVELGGAAPTPAFTIQPPRGGSLSLVMTNGSDIRGVKVTRYRLFRPFDANGLVKPMADAVLFTTHVFFINRLSSMRNGIVKLELMIAPGLDRLANVANRSLSTTTCTLKYRRWDARTSSFVYTSVADGGCPWGQTEEAANFPQCTTFGTPYFDASDETTADVTKDRCSQTMSGCLKRFPVSGNDPIPINIITKTA